jgi:hypothetical protein
MRGCGYCRVAKLLRTMARMSGALGETPPPIVKVNWLAGGK